jgi:hypothetical protein
LQKLKELQECNGNALCQLQVTAKWDLVDGKQDVGIAVGIVQGVGLSSRNALDSIAYMEPKDVVAGLKAVLTDPAVRASIAPSVLQSIDERINVISKDMEVAGWDASVEAGTAIGSLLFDAAAAVSAVRGGVALAKDLPAAAKGVAGVMEDLGALARKGAGATEAPATPNFVLVGGVRFVESPVIQANTTVSLSQDITIATGQVIPKGSLVTVSDDAMKVVFPDGRAPLKMSYGVATGEVPMATGAPPVLPTPNGVSVRNLTIEQVETLSFDVDKGKVTAGAIEEIRAAQAAQEEGLLGSGAISRGERGADLNIAGSDVSIKAYRSDEFLNDARSLSKLVGSLNADPNLKLLLDTRSLSSQQVTNIANALTQRGIDPARIIAPQPGSFGPITVVSPDGSVKTY